MAGGLRGVGGGERREQAAMKAANPLYVPTDISRAPKPRTDRPARQQITEEPKEATDNVVVSDQFFLCPLFH